MKSILWLLLSLPFYSLAQQASISFEQWISLKQSGSVSISPDGQSVLFSTTSTDWKENSYDSEYWLSKNGQAPFQLTRTQKGSSSGAQWSPDNKWIGFLADRGNKNQIHLLAVEGGESISITNEPEGINSFSWSPDGHQILFSKANPESKKDKNIKERYGAFGTEGEEYRMNHLFMVPFDLDSIELAGLFPCYKDSLSTDKTPCYSLPKSVAITEGPFTVGGYRWSPDGQYIAYTRMPDPLINSGIHADIVLYKVDTKASETIIRNPSSDFVQGWSPDSKQLVYTSAVEDTLSHFYKNNRMFIYDLATAKSNEIGTSFDENKNFIDWTPQGIWFSANQKTTSYLYLMDPIKRTWTRTAMPYDVFNGASFSKDGSAHVISARKYDGLSEVAYLPAGGEYQQLTRFTHQIKNWNTPTNEVIRWKSKDGVEIEGVLIKPRDFQANKKYPLLCLIHGGPTGVDRPEPTPSYVYPVMQWCEKGAMVLRVNYRGSAGYGEKFRALNVRNLGIGDMWDVMSGVEHVKKMGIVDTTKMGCMGWSQGGYISAFLTTNTNSFKAISVGAGISNWMTYYVNTDITPFTRQYLQATPWSDPAIYLKTSPINNINKAATPTLIQHGEFDKRVPIPNAYELYRGLQDRKVPSKLIVYKGFGHGITKPKERLAAIWHNWQWFNKYIWGEEIMLPD